MDYKNLTRNDTLYPFQTVSEGVMLHGLAGTIVWYCNCLLYLEVCPDYNVFLRNLITCSTASEFLGSLIWQ